jgi:hypothetical protein
MPGGQEPSARAFYAGVLGLIEELNGIESSSWSRSAPDSRTCLARRILGSLFMTTGTIWCLVLAWFGALMSRRLRENPSAGSKLTRASGAMFVGLGVKLAISR